MFCPRCGARAPESATGCPQCGQDLSEAARKLASSHGVPATTMSSPAGPRPSTGPVLRGTMLGVAVPAPGSSSPAPPLPPQVSRPPSVPPAGAHPSSTPPRPGSGRVGTMMGVAVPPSALPSSLAAAAASLPATAPQGFVASPYAEAQPHTYPNPAPPAHPRPASAPDLDAPPNTISYAEAQHPPPGPAFHAAPPPAAPTQPWHLAFPPPGTGAPHGGTLMGFAVPPGAGGPHSVGGEAPPTQAAPAASMNGYLASIVQRSYRTPADIVTELMTRHGEAALTDRHFVEQELWSEQARDVRLLLCALEEGVPKQLLARAATRPLQPSDVKLLAQGLAETKGLAEEAAEFAVAAWARAVCGLVQR